MSRQRKTFSLLFLLLQSAAFATAMADDSQEAADMAQVAAEAPPADSAAQQSENDAASLQQVLRERGWQVQSVGADGSVIVTLPQTAAEAAPPAEETEAAAPSEASADDTEAAAAPESATPAAGLQQALREHGWQVQSGGADGSVIVTLPQAAAPAAEAAPPAEETEAAAVSEKSADEPAPPAVDVQELHKILNARGWQSEIRDGMLIARFAENAPEPAPETHVTLSVPAKDWERLSALLRAQGWGLQGEIVIRLSPPAGP